MSSFILGLIIGSLIGGLIGAGLMGMVQVLQIVKDDKE